MIRGKMEPPLHNFFKEYCKKVKGVHYIESNGTEDHIHLVFQMEPFVVLSEFLGKIKGASSHEMNEQFGHDALHWQRGYGVVSFSKKHLDPVLQYVRDQKEHHKRKTILDALERSGDDEPEDHE